MAEGYRPWEIERLTEEEAYRVYASYKRKHSNEDIDRKELTRWAVWVMMHPWMDRKISEEEFWKWPHELPPLEVMMKEYEEQKKASEEWHRNAMAYLKRTGLIKDDGENVSELTGTTGG